MKLTTKDLSQTSNWLSHAERTCIAEIIQSSFSNTSPEDYLVKYFDAPDAFQRKLRLYFDGETIVGYCLLTFSEEYSTIVIRASAGFLPAYRKGGNTFGFSLAESFKCWLKQPWRNIYYADTMLSPAMYRAIAKNTGIIWPHPEQVAPATVFEQFNPKGACSEALDLRCLVSVGRASNYSDGELEGFKSSDKPEIQYYQTVNPEFNRGVALFVIIPVNFKQFIRTAWMKLIA